MTETAAIRRYELELHIDAPPERVWTSLVDSVDAWWLPDYRVSGSDASVHLDPRPGGTLVEVRPDGGGLVWYTVQMVAPGSALHLVGDIGPGWGGPARSMLEISLEPDGDGCRLAISDAILGAVDKGSVAELEKGWLALFSALKSHAEDHGAKA